MKKIFKKLKGRRMSRNSENESNSGTFDEQGSLDLPPLSTNDVEEDCHPVQESTVSNINSDMHRTIHRAYVGNTSGNNDQRVISGQSYQSGVSIFKQRNQEVVPENRMNNLNANRGHDIIPETRNLYDYYRKEIDRLKTFHDWPPNAKVRKEDLARSGFIFLHSRDRVQCVFCRGVLSSWEHGDIVENEHKTHCPECPHAFGYECGNIPLNVAVLPRQNVTAPPNALRNRPNPSLVNSHNRTATLMPSPVVQNKYPHNTTIKHNINDVRAETSGLPFDDAANRMDSKGSSETNTSSKSYYESKLPPPSILPSLPSMGSPPNTAPPMQMGAKPRYPAWGDERTRLKSFRGWPAQMTQTPIDLAAAGLLYMGSGDRCKCFWCGGELYDWEQDDVPWEEHAKWFPHCAYVLNMKGANFVKYIQDKQNGLVSPLAELMGSPHVLAVLRENYTETQVEEAFNRFGVNSLPNAQSIINAIEKTKKEREEAQRRLQSTNDRMGRLQISNEEQPSGSPQNRDNSWQRNSSGRGFWQSSEEPSEDREMMEISTNEPLPKPMIKVQHQSSDSRPGSSCSLNSSTSRENIDVENLLQENEKLKDQKMCKICMDQDVCVMFNPCKHFVTCEACSHSVVECPVCRKLITDRIQVYWS